MRAIHQTIFPPAVSVDDMEALPGDQRGNCLQACVASLLELPLDDVPHFVSYPMEEWWFVVERFFADRGLGICWQPLNPEHGGWAPLGVDVMVTGKSPRGEFNHVVLYRDWQLSHDPHPSGDGLDGEPRGVYHLYPLDPARWAQNPPAGSGPAGTHNDRVAP